MDYFNTRAHCTLTTSITLLYTLHSLQFLFNSMHALKPMSCRLLYETLKFFHHSLLSRQNIKWLQFPPKKKTTDVVLAYKQIAKFFFNLHVHYFISHPIPRPFTIRLCLHSYHSIWRFYCMHAGWLSTAATSWYIIHEVFLTKIHNEPAFFIFIITSVYTSSVHTHTQSLLLCWKLSSFICLVCVVLSLTEHTTYN